MLHLIWGSHTSQDVLDFAQALDESCATRWLCYFHPSVDVSGMDIAHLPEVKRTFDEKRNELFGDKPKAYALVCASKATDQFFDFWERYDTGLARGFSGSNSLDVAYDWLGLSEAARAAVSATIQRWEEALASGVRSGSNPCEDALTAAHSERSDIQRGRSLEGGAEGRRPKA